jgi:hypothetical protein
MRTDALDERRLLDARNGPPQRRHVSISLDGGISISGQDGGILAASRCDRSAGQGVA